MKPHDPMSQEEYRAALVVLFGTTRANRKLSDLTGISFSLCQKASSGHLDLTGPRAYLVRVLAWPDRFMVIKPLTIEAG